VAAKLEGDVLDNGRPVKTSPVIRRVEAAAEDTASRVLTRLVPAFVISGAIHVVLIGFFVLFLASPKDANAKPSNDLATTQVEDPKEDEKNLTNEDVGFDPDLAAATNAEREETVNVEAPKMDEAVGLPDQPSEVAPLTQMAGLGADALGGKIGDLSPSGDQMAGAGGGAGAFTTPGMVGRSGATKDKLLKAGGGNALSEAAVAAGLTWLARQQEKDGSWKFDGISKDRVAATGMALLPFLAAGETHKYGTKYKQTVEKGLTWLMSRAGPNGFPGLTNNMYSIAIAAVALNEAAGMTKDPAVKAKATAVTGFIVKAQGRNGSWGYSPNTDGDTSIVGWQIQALASARLAEIKFDKDKVYKDANRFLESVSSDSGAKYGYRDRTPTPTLSAVGLLSKYYMGEMNPRHPAFTRGVDFLKQSPPDKGYWDMYYYYYATQVMHFFEGPDWHKFWNPKMRDLLIDMQDKSGDDAKRGSWQKDMGHIGSQCGRLGTTCLALLTLEVYYRHLPLYKRDSGGLADLEKQ
jgi:hypothetical protein